MLLQAVPGAEHFPEAPLPNGLDIFEDSLKAVVFEVIFLEMGGALFPTFQIQILGRI